MENNNLIPYKRNIFAKIANFFKKIFSKKKEYTIENNKENNIINYPNEEKIDEKNYQYNYASNEFFENIVIKENTEEIRLKKLQLQYDNGEIDEEDITDEDMEKIIEMYEKETAKLNEDTEMRKIHISKMLKELKNT